MYQPDRIWSFTTRFRFDEGSFEMRRFETEARASFDRWSVAMLYGQYDAQPQLGFLERREGITISWRSWAAFVRWLESRKHRRAFGRRKRA